MGNCHKVLKGGLHTSLHLFSCWVHRVPVGVQYTILKRASRRSLTMSRQYQDGPMTLDLCNWVVHMGNWHKVLKRALARLH